ncbi:MAG TPA: hypothetical protein VFH83_10335, partial [Spirochaetia bacterium]|nr:hypothetical protein [Spirochaetia bacterium]
MSTRINKPGRAAIVGAIGLTILVITGLSGCQQLLSILGLSHTLTVTVSPSEAGYITRVPDLTNYSNGDKVQVTATANSGYTFSNWSGDASGTANPVTLTMDADKLVTAVFTAASASGKSLTAFSFPTIGATGVINQTAHTIAVTVPFGTNVTSLVATFTTTGAQVKIGATVQASGVTPNDFTNPVSYTVVAADASTQAYLVTVSAASASDKRLTSFGFVSPAVFGVIDQTGNTISVTVPSDTDVTHLVAEFVSTGALVLVGATIQASGTTTNDFSQPVTY